MTLTNAGKLAVLTLLLLQFGDFAAGAQQIASAEDLRNLSIDQLANIQIYSVTKAAQPLSDAPAAVYVIGHDDIIRSGANSLGEMLRLAPNLQVAQMSADSFAITARGFNGNAADKLLVLIDGRSVYTPLYGGVLWDEKDVLPDDIERIEVISGPGATLWGANAVNGVINIVTKNSTDTQGGVIDLSAGNLGGRASVQYGGKIEDDLSYRAYAEGFSIPHDNLSTGGSAGDGWSKGQGGFRLDWTPQGDAVTLQSDLYDGSEGPTGGKQNIWGGNLEANWQHQLDDGSSLQMLSYYDATRRYSGPLGYSLDTYDLELQHSFSLGTYNDIIWGVGGRVYQDQFDLATAPVQFMPTRTTETLADIFAQDSMSLTPSLSLILGLKLENDPFTAIEPLPNVRLSWKLDEDTLVWAAISRAVRAPTRFDTDLSDTILPSILVLTGNRNFLPERLDAYELGTRIRPISTVSFSVSAFYNVYDDLRSIEWLNMDATKLPLLWTYGNMMQGDAYGVEAWADYQAADWWRLSAGFNIQHEDLSFKPGSSELGGVASAGDDPNHQVSLRSSMNLLDDVSWNADLRWIGMLPNPQIPSYVELNTKLAWNVSNTLQLSLAGFNLLQAKHVEYEEAGATFGDEVDRSFYVETKWKF